MTLNGRDNMRTRVLRHYRLSFSKAFLACIALLLTAALLTACGDGNYTDVEHVERAKDFKDEGDYRAAAIELKNALQKNPDNPEARWLLGLLSIEVGDGFSAEKELSKAMELGVTAESIVPDILKALLLQNNYSRVLDYNTSAVRSDNAVAEVLASKGIAYLKTGEREKAKESLSMALQHNAKSLHALFGLAELHMLQRQYDEMNKYLETIFEHDADYAQAWSLKGDDARERREVGKAIEAYTKAIKNTRNNGEDMLKRAFLYIQLKKYEEAQKDINNVKKRFPKQSSVSYAQGMLYFYQEKFGEARTALEQAVNLNPNDVWATYYLGVTHFVQNNHEQARTYLGKFVKVMPGYIPGRKLYAYIMLKDGQLKEAESYIRPVLKANPTDIYAMNILASALQGQGRGNEASALLQQAVAANPDSPVAQMNLGINKLRQDDEAGGVEYLERAIELEPGFGEARATLALFYLKDKNVPKAIEVAEAFVKEQPDNPFASVLAGKIYLEAKREGDAIKMFEKASELSPGNPTSNSFLAALALKKNQIADARKYYRDILKHHDNDLLTLINLAVLDGRAGDRDSAKVNLEKAVTTHPDSVQARILLAREYLKDGKVEQAGALLSEIKEEHKDNESILALLGEVQLRGNQFSAAKDTYQQLVKLNPQDPTSHYFLAMAHEGLGEKSGLKSELKRALDLAPNYALANIAQARLHMAEGDLKTARQLLSTLKKGELKDSPVVLALEGEILATAGEDDNALAVFNKLYSKEQNRGNLRLLSRHLWKMGKRNDSLTHLEQWAKANPDDIEITLELANNYLGAAREADALRKYRQVLEKEDNNLIALNNLAWYLRKSDPKQSLAYAEKAQTLAPDSVTIMDTLALSLLENGELTRGQRILERALAKRPGDPTLIYHQALLLEKMGQKAQARDSLQSLLAKKSEFSERGEAEKLLARLKGG